MTDDSLKKSDVIAVLANQQLRLAKLETGLAHDEAVDRLRAEADALIAAEGSKAALGLVEPIDQRAPPPPPSWEVTVAKSRAGLVEAGLDPDAIHVEDLLGPEMLVRVEGEWRALVADVEEHISRERMDALVGAARGAVLDAIVRPFGLGRLVARLDKVGGGVLTLHNAEEVRQGRLGAEDIANRTRAEAYAERQDTAESSRHRAYSGDGFREARRSPSSEDAYTGLPLDPARTDIDHVIPASRLDKDMRVNFHFDEQGKEGLINAPENLAATDRSINRSKGSETIPEWLERSVDGEPNKERFSVDEAKMRQRHAEADRHVLGAVRSEEVRYYLKETAKAGAADAVKLGLQQALGAVLIEAAVGVFDELADLIRHGRREAGIAADLKMRAARVVKRVLASWDDVLAAFKQGAIGGLLSAVITAVINMFVTTAKRAVRIIREGALSLVRAVGLLVNPPVGMDLATAAHEASKVVAGALAVSAGIMIEQTVETAITTAVPVLAPIAPALTMVAVGLATGLSTVLLVAMLDRFDLFGVVARERGARRDRLFAEQLNGMLDELLPSEELVPDALP